MALSNLTKVQTLGIGSNIEVVGVITTGQFKSGTSNLHSSGVDLTNLNVSGIATIAGSISIGGTLTYQDVTNIDSVGIITARSNIDCNGDLDVDGHTELDNVNIAGVSTFQNNVHLLDNDKLLIGTGQDLELFHDGTNSIIQNNTNSFYVASNDLRLTSFTGAENYLKGTRNGAVELYYDNVKKFETTGAGVTVTNGHLQQQYGGIASKVGYVSGGAEAYFGSTSNHSLVLGTNNTERLRITTSGSIGLNGANYGSAGQVFTSQGSGSAPTWSTISGTTINGNTDDYIITASGTANTLNGESNLIFTGSRLGINPSGGTITDIPSTAHDTVVLGNSSATSGGITLEGASGSGNLAFQMYKQGGQPCARFMYERSSNSVRFDSATGSSPGSGEALRMRLHPDGDVEIADGDLIIGTSGHGIDFGATANGGTGSPNEIFDDYEEGSWTPTIEGLSNSPGYHNRGGNYTKIGNRVFLQCHIQISSPKPQFSNQSAAFKISGLPFTGSGISGGGYFGAHGVCVWQQLQWVGGSYSSYGHNDDTQLSPGIVDGGTRITLQTCGQGIYYVGQMLNRAAHDNYSWNIEFDMSYRTAT